MGLGGTFAALDDYLIFQDGRTYKMRLSGLWKLSAISVVQIETDDLGKEQKLNARYF